jgi:predicted O-methyltransferase YrrM
MSNAARTDLKPDHRDRQKTNDTGFCSLSDEMLALCFAELEPTSQAESFADLNIGFGFIYYALARTLRPELTVVFGSRMGFSAICFALAIRDNGNGGRLIFVDAGYDDDADGKERGFGGVGFWRDTPRVARLLNRFGVADVIDVKLMLTSEFAEFYKAQNLPPVDLLLIDADHSYRGFKYDFETFKEIVRDDGLMLCHDTEVDDGYGRYRFGVGEYFRRVARRDSSVQAISLPVWPGLGIVRKAGAVRGSPPRRWRWLHAIDRRIPIPAPLRSFAKSAAHVISTGHLGRR